MSWRLVRSASEALTARWLTQVHNQTRTKEMGSLTAELLDSKTKDPIPGFTLNDSVPLAIDTYADEMRWKGGKVAMPTASVRVRFVVLRARLYSFDWV